MFQFPDQPTVKLAFYKAPGTLIDKIIRWGTKTKYSHVEFIGPDGKGWSVSPRDTTVRKKDIDFDDGHWDLIEVPWASCELMCNRIEAEMGKKYDWKGIIFNHILSLSRSNPDKWFCSELVAYGLGLEQPEIYSPGSLFNTVNFMTTFQKAGKA